MVGSNRHWRFAVCIVSLAMVPSAAACSSGGQTVPSSSPAEQATTAQQAAPSSTRTGQPTTSSNASTSATPSAVKLTSGILALTSVGNKRIYSYIDPTSGQYSEAVTFTIPTAASAQGVALGPLAASPDLSKMAVTEMVNDQTATGWIDSSGQFTAVTPSTTTGPFGGDPPLYAAIGFDGAGNYYYKQISQGAMHTDVYEVPSGSTSNPKKLTVTPPSAADNGAELNSDGGLLFGCQNMTGNWLDANTMVMAIAPGTQIAKVPLAGREKSGCPITPATNEVTLLPTSNTAKVHDPVANPDGSKVAFFYDDPDRVNHNYLSLYVVGTDGNSQPTLVNLSESDAKKLTGAMLLRWT
jgi:hypothetical protein